MLRVRAGQELVPLAWLALFAISYIIMPPRKNNIKKAKPVGRPAVNATPVLVRIRPSQLESLDRWRKRQEEGLGRPEAIRKLIELALGGGKKR